MIRNIVFDMGKTVIVFDPEYFMDVEGIIDTDDRKLVYCELFHSVEWAQMDLGVLTEETAEPLILERIPERLKDKVKHLLTHWWEKRALIPGMAELLEELKSKGYKLYLLSNASVWHHQYWPTFPISRLFDGKLISCDYGIIKPNPKIYQLFTEKFQLDPGECLFVDDLTANVAAAIQCGWKGIVFQGEAEQLKKSLALSGVSIDG